MSCIAHPTRALALTFSCGALLAALAIASPVLAASPTTAAAPGTAARAIDFDPTAIDDLTSADRPSAKVVFVSGTVHATDKDFLGRTQKVAIVSVGDAGMLFQNAVEDESAGEELKHHVGEDVTARGVVLVKADGSMSLLVDAFQIRGGEGGFVGGRTQSY